MVIHKKEKRKNQKFQQIGAGSGYITGVDIKNIDNLLAPLEIDSLVLWIKADKKYLVKETVRSYILKISPESKEPDLDKDVITEIKSAGEAFPNSLVPLHTPNDLPTTFPTFISELDKLDAIDISNYTDPYTQEHKSLKLTTKFEILLPAKYSKYIISTDNVKMEYINNNFIISTDYLEIPSTTLLESDIPMVTPFATFSEIIVFSKELAPDDARKMEGYIAYKKNEQYNLPVDHPYLPDMMDVLELQETSNSFKNIIERAKNALANSEIIKAEAIKSSINDFSVDSLINNMNDIHKKLVASLSNINTIKQLFSKGYLYVKKHGNITFENIINAINTNGWSTVPFSTEMLNVMIMEYITDINQLVIQNNNIKNKLPIQSGGGEQDDYTVFSKEENDTKDFYKGLRIKNRDISSAGKIAYSKFYNSFEEEIRNLNEVFNYQYTKIINRDSTLQTLFKPIHAKFQDGSWLTPLTFLDVTISEKITRYNQQYSLKYREPSLNIIQTYYIYAREQFAHGDYAYIQQKIEEIRSIFKSILILIENKRIHPVLRTTYISFLKDNLEIAQNYFEHFISIAKDIEIYLTNINIFLNIAVQTKQPKIFDTPPPVETYIYPPQIQTIYLKHVNRQDSTLTGIEYVQTDALGSPIDGKTVLYFPTYINFQKEVKTPYLTESGDIIYQKYEFLDAFIDSIFSIFSKTSYEAPVMYAPNLIKYTVSALIEVSRQEINKIHCVQCKNSVDPIILPKNAIKVGDYFVIYNFGSIPILVRNCGTPDAIDCIGPSEAYIYIYTGISDENTTYYGRVNWYENQLPYDTLQNAPRTSLAMFISELNTSVYIRKKMNSIDVTLFEPVYDTNGYLVEMKKYKDGYVYDIDDIFYSRPYIIDSVSEDLRKNLQFEEGKKKILSPIIKKIHIGHDILTGLAIMCSEAGYTCVNEYGFCKVANTPIQLINNSPIIRGAYGDIKLYPNINTFIQIYTFEPFLSFSNLFRSRFVQQDATQKTYIFVTNSINPIVAPNFKAIEVPNWKESVHPSELSYDDIDTMKVLKMSPLVSKVGDAILYPYIDIAANSMKQEISRMTRICITQYEYAVIYIENKIKDLQYIQTKILRLTQTEIKDVIQDIKDTSVILMKYLEDLNTYRGTVNFLNIQVLQPIMVTDKLKIAVNEFDSKTSKFLEDTFTVEQSLYARIKIYIESIAEIDKIIEDAIHINENTDIKSSILKVQDTLQSEIKLRETTSAPEIESILDRMILKQNEYNVKNAEFTNLISSRPKLISEVHTWYLDVQSKLKSMWGIIKEIKRCASLELSQTLQTYHETYKETLVNSIKKSSLSIRHLYDLIKPVGLWIGAFHDDEQQPYNLLEPNTSGANGLHGLTIEYPIFNVYSNPSVKRDWNIYANDTDYQILVLKPLEDIVKQVSTLIYDKLLKEKGDTKEDPSTIRQRIERFRINDLQKTDDELKDLLAKFTTNIQIIETAFIPVIKAVEQITLKIYEKALEPLVTTWKIIQDEWVTINEKRTTFETAAQSIKATITPENSIKLGDIETAIDAQFNLGTDIRFHKCQQQMNEISKPSNPNLTVLPPLTKILDALLIEIKSIHTELDKSLEIFKTIFVQKG